MEQPSAFSFCIKKPDKGKRLDIFLSEKIDDHSRSFISQLIKDKHIRVNGQFKKPGYVLKFSDTVTVTVPVDQPSSFLPEPMNLSILFEDGDIIVVNKPPGLVVHPAPGHSSGTLVNGLLHHCPDLKGIGGKIRPGIVHRLDKDTSGVIVAAKHSQSHEHLSRQFKLREVKKEYVALVVGEFESDSGLIRQPIGRHPVYRKKMSTNSRRTRDAETRWKISERFPGITLVTIDLKTGRTHQIRVHFSSLGHPVLGDPVYGGRKRGHQISGPIREIIAPVKRQMLHAGRLSITHPATKKAMSFEAPVPKDMADIIEKLKSLSSANP